MCPLSPKRPWQKQIATSVLRKKQAETLNFVLLAEPHKEPVKTQTGSWQDLESGMWLISTLNPAEMSPGQISPTEVCVPRVTPKLSLVVHDELSS